ncbi:MAG: ABC transporter, ATP-binding protein (cluster 11, riboflavin/purine nucleoside/unknown) / ABC transporter, ATP-binding protein (cluster 11, riboflavin/purine nucleoside/unknown), partial [uncultured Corynebacteriales bacterium]
DRTARRRPDRPGAVRWSGAVRTSRTVRGTGAVRWSGAVRRGRAVRGGGVPPGDRRPHPRRAQPAQPPSGGAGPPGRGQPELRQRDRARHPAAGRLAAGAPGPGAGLRPLPAAGRQPARPPPGRRPRRNGAV